MTAEEAKKIRNENPASEFDWEALAAVIDTALDKQIPMKPNVFHAHPKPLCLCPTCGSGYIMRHGLQMNNCNSCGQAIDWSDT